MFAFETFISPKSPKIEPRGLNNVGTVFSFKIYKFYNNKPTEKVVGVTPEIFAVCNSEKFKQILLEPLSSMHIVIVL